MAHGSIFEVLQYFCFKYTNISGELMLCNKASHIPINIGQIKLLRPTGRLDIGLCFVQFVYAEGTYEPRNEKTNVLHMRKQRRRSADQRLYFRYIYRTIPLPSKFKFQASSNLL